jgi:hypothetical protein
MSFCLKRPETPPPQQVDGKGSRAKKKCQMDEAL